MVHIFLVMFLFSRIVAPGLDSEATRRGEMSMTMLDLTEPGSPAPARSSPQSQPATPSPTSPVDASVPDVPIPAEWSVSRLPPSAPAPAAPSSAPRSPGGVGAGAGQGGPAAYDPYAGAAPARLEPQPAAQSRSMAGQVMSFLGFGADGPALDQAALEEVRKAVARSLPGQTGTAEIVVRVSPAGMVLEADVRGGSAAPRLRDALARALRGKQLFRGTSESARIVTLPVLRFG